MRTVVLCAMLLSLAGCGQSGPPPDVDATPPGDARADALDPDALRDPGVYAGTCFEAVVECFDGTLRCTFEEVDGPGFDVRFDNGARHVIDPASGTSSLTRSDGTECFTATTDPATSDLVYTTPQGIIRERYGPSEREITCPDGQMQTAPLGDPPWVLAVEQCVEI